MKNSPLSPLHFELDNATKQMEKNAHSRNGNDV